FAIEAVDAKIVGDLPDDIDHRRPAAARAEERVHVDRSIDRPVDVLVEHGFEIGGLAFIDRAMQRARKTPETMLCHFGWSLKLDLLSGNRAQSGRLHRRRAKMPDFTVTARNRTVWSKHNCRFCIAQMR